MEFRHLGYALLLAFPLAACGGDEGAPANHDADAAATGAEAAGASHADGDAASPAALYPAESGIIEWKSNMVGEMTTVLYFAEGGAKRATYTTTVVESFGKLTTRSVQIEADGWIVEYDPDAKTGKRWRPTSFSSMRDLAGVPDLPAMSDGVAADGVAADGFEELEPRTFFGKEARGFAMEAMGMKVRSWTWEGIPMRTEMNMGDKEPMVQEITRLELGAAVPAEKFTVPADVELTVVGS